MEEINWKYPIKQIVKFWQQCDTSYCMWLILAPFSLEPFHIPTRHHLHLFGLVWGTGVKIWKNAVFAVESFCESGHRMQLNDVRSVADKR